MKKIFLVLLTAVMLVGCSGEVNSVDGKNKNELKIKNDSGSYYDYIYTYIITDTETDREYIVVRNTSPDGGVAITPRLRSEP